MTSLRRGIGGPAGKNGFASGTISMQIMEEVDKIQLPPGYKIIPVGQEEIRQESNTNIMEALVLAGKVPLTLACFTLMRLVPGQTQLHRWC